jgi:YidC/Oxa1 family membrane protein insertase
MNENRNLLLAVLLSAAVLFGWEYFVAKPQAEKERAAQAQLAHPEKQISAAAPRTQRAGAGALTRAQALRVGGMRIAIDTPTADGSLLLKGARFDDLRLRNYRETTDPKSPEIVLLSPEGTPFPYYAVFGWVAPSGSGVRVPGDDTVWTQVGEGRLTPNSPVTLKWDNGKGLVFTRIISVDNEYMFKVRDAVTNHGASRVTLYPYADVVRDGVPTGTKFWALHEGFVGVADGTLKDADYSDFKDDEPPKTFQSTGGWLAITDKYWMAAVIPPQTVAFDGEYRGSQLGAVKAYQADYRLGAEDIGPGSTVSVGQRLFAGAKIAQLLQTYEDKDGVAKLHYAIDWGWFFFITQPIFYALDYFSHYMNVGLAILLLTVTIKLLFFPLADASYRSMSRMKKLQPEIERLKVRFADDKVQQQQEMMELYKREKINPVSGCLPMLIQIPVFFSLYKVLLGSIEMRQAPFFGWIHDLSAPDPTNFLNLFGLLPYSIPAALHIGDFSIAIPVFLHVGIWPILMGVTQWIQTKLNPPAADPVQQRMFAFMPLIFTFMLAGLPSGLVIYWTWNNLLSVAQQYVMMRRQGVKVNLFENIKLPAFARRLTSGQTARPDSPPGE